MSAIWPIFVSMVYKFFVLNVPYDYNNYIYIHIVFQANMIRRKALWNDMKMKIILEVVIGVIIIVIY